ncbi:MAG: nucleotide-binding protein [Bryobacteraceae bacterium]|nr:MAG: nucleotide-binding protein [Bryobacteraceae bacterium]
MARRFPAPELVIITGLSGSGKGTVLKALEDHGYYAVDNLPVDLIPKFAELTRDSPNIRRAALVVDIREREHLHRLPEIIAGVRKKLRTRLVFLEADEEALVRRYSETRRPHPLGGARSLLRSVRLERQQLAGIRELADYVINTSELNVHELRRKVAETFCAEDESGLQIYVMSFGFKHGLPPESDLVFDVRFLPNPNYIPELKRLTGRHQAVARYVKSFPQTGEFLERITSLLLYLIPHYVAEGKSYLTIAFGCTGGRHRSVMIAGEVQRRLKKAGYWVRLTHRDIEKE